MSTRHVLLLLLGIGAVALVAIGILVWSGDPNGDHSTASPRGSERGTVGVGPTQPPADVPPLETAEAAPLESETTAPPLPADHARLTGTVVDATSRLPVAGAAVEAWILHESSTADRRAGSAHPGESRPDVTSVSDAGGRFLLDVQAPCVVDTLTARAGPGGPVATLGDSVALRPGERAAVSLVVPAGLTLLGTVETTEGSPLAGVAVRVRSRHDLVGPIRPVSAGPFDRQVTSDRWGRFEIGGVGPAFAIWAESEDWIPRKGYAGHALGRTAIELVLLVVPPRRVRGRVRDEQGRPVPGATVSVRPVVLDSIPRTELWTIGPRTVSTTTDDDGLFEADGLASGSIRLHVDHPEFLDRSVEARARGEELVEIVLERGACVAGTVAATGPGSVDGARLACVRIGNMVSGAADAAGGFRLCGIDAEPLLLAWAPGRAVVGLPLSDVPPSERDRISFLLPPEAPLAGRVVDETGLPIAFAEMVVVSPDVLDDWPPAIDGTPWTWQRVMDLDRIVADAHGRFAFHGLAEDVQHLTVFDPLDHRVTASFDVSSPSGDLELVFDRRRARGVVVSGRVVDPEEQPVTGFKVSVSEVLGAVARGFARHVVDTEGRFTVAGTPPGPVRIQVSAPGFVPWTHDEELDVGEHTFDIQLEPSLQLLVEVRTPEDRPVGGATVQLLDGRDQAVWSHTARRTSASVWTDRHGRAVLDGLPLLRGTLVVSVVPPAGPFDRPPEPIEVRQPVDLGVTADRHAVVILDLPEPEVWGTTSCLVVVATGPTDPGDTWDEVLAAVARGEAALPRVPIDLEIRSDEDELLDRVRLTLSEGTYETSSDRGASSRSDLPTVPVPEADRTLRLVAPPSGRPGGGVVLHPGGPAQRVLILR